MEDIKFEIAQPDNLPRRLQDIPAGYMVCRVGTDCRHIVADSPSGERRLIDPLNWKILPKGKFSDRYHIIAKINMKRTRD